LSGVVVIVEPAGPRGNQVSRFAALPRVQGTYRIDLRTVTVFHGLRHTCATLLLQAGTPVHVVSERLGHSKVTMTLEVYAHVLPDMQTDAAATLGALLHG
jgi:integrase